MTTTRRDFKKMGGKILCSTDTINFEFPDEATGAMMREMIAMRPDLLIEFNERAAILEYDAKLDRQTAEREAEKMINEVPNEQA